MIAPVIAGGLIAAGGSILGGLFGGSDAPEIPSEQRELQRAQKEFLDLQTSLVGGTAEDLQGLQPQLLELLGISGFGARQTALSEQAELQSELDRLLTLSTTLAPGSGGRFPNQIGGLTGTQSTRVRELQGLLKDFDVPELSIGGPLTQFSELQDLLFGRTKAAFAGEIDNPALLRDIREQQETLQNQLRKELGSGFRTSTPGIEALGSFGERSLVAKDVSRRADISQLIPQFLNVGQGRGQTLAQILGIVSAPAGLPFGQVNTGFAQAQQPFIAQNQIAAQFAQQPGFLQSLAGNVAGGLAGAGTSALIQNLTQGGLGGSPAASFTGFEPNPTFTNPSF